MKKFAFISKAVLLYGTALYFILLIISIESLTETNPQLAFLSLFILLVLLAVCKWAFKDEDLDNYKPKWFR